VGGNCKHFRKGVNMKGYLYTRIMFIRGQWHVERRVNNKWVVKLCDHKPTEEDVERLFSVA